MNHTTTEEAKELSLNVWQALASSLAAAVAYLMHCGGFEISAAILLFNAVFYGLCAIAPQSE